jgi:hypothetical protein
MMPTSASSTSGRLCVAVKEGGLSRFKKRFKNQGTLLPGPQHKGGKHMAHNHGNEYQIRIVREDGIEELSGWMSSKEQVAQAMLAVQKSEGKSYWLLVRNILCPYCTDREQIMEYPIMHVPSSRFIPHDSRYRGVVERTSFRALVLRP